MLNESRNSRVCMIVVIWYSESSVSKEQMTSCYWQRRELLQGVMKTFCGVVEMFYIMIVLSIILVDTIVKTH